MQIKNAYAVTVDFDGDIRSDASGFWIFAGEDARKEVRGLVRQALTDMYVHEKQRGRMPTEWYSTPINDIAADNSRLDMFIDYGGSSFGNWEITIQYTEG